MELSYSHFFKRNTRASTLKFTSQEVIFFFELINNCSLENMVSRLILEFEVKIMILKSKLGLILTKLLVDILHLFMSRKLHLFNYMLLIVLILFFEGFQLDSKILFLSL